MNDIAVLLQQLIKTPSFSREEENTAQILAEYLTGHGCAVLQQGNNVWARNKFFDPAKETLLLNSHHDTVKPNAGYTRNPFDGAIEGDKIFGLGSNDAGGALVCLLHTFLYFYEKQLPFNIVFAATAEEEISGKGGVESILSELGNVTLAIVGEPTQMQMAVAERGLLVLDCVAKGKAGHAARNEGINAIYAAMKDIDWFRTYRFEKNSEWLGPVSMNVTVVNAGAAHNQVPEECKFVADIRLNECYTHRQVLEVIRQHVKAEVKERSARIKPSFIELNHPLLKAAAQLNIQFYGSPTTSDMALMPWRAVKIGPGDSARSHSADEFIYLKELEQAIDIYIALINQYSKQFKAT